MGTKEDNKLADRHGYGQVCNRLNGEHPQRQKGLFMQRIRIPGGRLSWTQWRAIVRLAAKFSPGFPLHITTRQNIELHNLLAGGLPIVQEALAQSGLTCLGAGGDSVRNITVCPGCEYCPGGFDLLPLARIVRHHLEQQQVIFDLPRKFKISFSGCLQACGKPWLNDLGFIAQQDGSFTVTGAGSLGAKPALGVELYRDLPAKDIPPLCLAAIEFFADRGERSNRARARFRHVREKLGDQPFRAQLHTRFKKIKARQSWPELYVEPSKQTLRPVCRLQLPAGNIYPKESVGLADFVEPLGTELRINLEHGLELYGAVAVKLPKSLAVLASNPVIIACPGSSTCPRALADTWAIAERIRENLSGEPGADVRISISGCPNNCGHSATADIGLVGLRRKQGAGISECYRLFMGGGNGRNRKLAQQCRVVPARQVPAAIKSLLRGAKTPKWHVYSFNTRQR